MKILKILFDASTPLPLNLEVRVFFFPWLPLHGLYEKVMRKYRCGSLFSFIFLLIPNRHFPMPAIQRALFHFRSSL